MDVLVRWYFVCKTLWDILKLFLRIFWYLCKRTPRRINSHNFSSKSATNHDFAYKVDSIVKLFLFIVWRIIYGKMAEDTTTILYVYLKIIRDRYLENNVWYVQYHLFYPMSAVKILLMIFNAIEETNLIVSGSRNLLLLL